MTTPQIATQPRTVAFMDLGTNSLRLLVARIQADGSYSILSQLKEMVRLGEGEFEQQELQPEAIDRAVAAARRFALQASADGASEVVAVATSATRDAANRDVFLRRLREEAGISVQVVSGTEEARLIYLGVVSGERLRERQALCIDIGGGSTEVGVGDQNGPLYLGSIRVGAIRLTGRFLAGWQGPVPNDLYKQIRRAVREEATPALAELRDYSIDVALGSSGTIENLQEIAARMYAKRSDQEDTLSYSQLRDAVTILRSQSLAERRRVPGLNPTRADIIIAGAAILETLMSELDLSRIQISARGLREGLLIDYLQRHGQLAAAGDEEDTSRVS